MALDVEIAALRVGDVESPLPRYQTPGAAGMDLPAALREPVTIAPGERVLLPTGWSFAIPEGFEAQVRPRSGLAWRHGVTVLNSPGTIDADYRGELKVLLVNLSDAPFRLTRGERVAQLVVCPVERAELVVVDELETTAR